MTLRISRMLAAFIIGFVLSVVLFVVILVLLRMTVPYSSELFGARLIPYDSVTDSPEWLNFILYRVLTHFDSDEVLNNISELVNTKIGRNKFELLWIGNVPVVGLIETFMTGDPDSVEVLIPIEWHDGCALNFTVAKLRTTFEIDVKHFIGKVMVSWPGESALHIQFQDAFDIDFEVIVRVLGRRVSLTRAPILGAFIKGIVSLIVSRQSFKIDIPKPKPVYYF